MFFIFLVSPIIDPLKIRNRLANIPKVFSITFLARDKVSKQKFHLQRKQMEIFLVTRYSFIVVGSGILSKFISIVIPN